MRSLLLVPGDAADRLASAAGADVLVFDLFGTVASSAKEQARDGAARYLQAAGRSTNHAKLFVRVNNLGSGLVDLDLDAVMPARPDGIMLPDAVGGADVARLGAMLAVREAEHGLEDGATRIVAVAAASGRGILALGSIAGSSPRLSAIGWDAHALRADLGGRTIRDETGAFTDPYRTARSLILFASAAARVDAIDTPHADFAEPDSLATQSRAARRDGFVGKMALNAAQVPVINTAFAASPGAGGRPR